MSEPSTVLTSKKLNGVIETRQFDKETIEKIFSLATKMKKEYPRDLLTGKIMVSLFYEPSTRTKLSFESAMIRLGGSVIGTENAREFSSFAKGEKLEDSVRVISEYGDIIVLRYNEEGGAQRAQKAATIPVINAGDGPGQHPTQALLDLYTINEHFGKIDGLRIALVGDLLNGRTVRSLCYLLAKHYPNNFISLISPKQTRMRKDILNFLKKYNVSYEETSELLPVLPEVDVIYQTRVQKERFQDKTGIYLNILEARKKLIINENSLTLMKENAIIMHPLPRNDEISHEVDKDPRAYYFRQAKNGLYVRMALLKMIFADY